MGDVMFYHLTQSSAAQVLHMLLPKTLEAGWQVELRGPDRPIMEALDGALWQGPEDGFLPHGLAGGPQDADQPVLLCWDDAPKGRACVISVGGAALAPSEAQEAARVCVLFDGHDEAALTQARAQWRALTEAGLVAQYWAQEDGRWMKKAQSDGA